MINPIDSPRFHNPVRNPQAANYILLTLVTFAVTVVGTRLYLELAGYPQLGNKTFHIAHALWGGLFLIIAVMLLLIFVNRYMYSTAAIFAGIGVGLFIDEVGKFITQTNDYFFPLAAPIIYVGFLLILVVYLSLRRPRLVQARSEMYDILEEFQEILDDDLQEREYKALVSRLQPLTRQSERPDLAALAQALLDFLESNTQNIRSDEETWITRQLDRWQHFEDSRLDRVTLRRVLIVILAALSFLSALTIAVLLLVVFDRNTLGDLFVEDIIRDNACITGMTSFVSYMVLLSGQFVTGVLYIISLALFWMRRETLAINLGGAALIVSITALNTLNFYFNQFAVVLDSLALFGVLILMLRYRARYLMPQNSGRESSQSSAEAITP
jgi:hypothetical protein